MKSGTIAALFHHADDKTLRQWLGVLADAGFLEENASYYTPTASARKAVQAGYISAPELRLLRRLQAVDMPLLRDLQKDETLDSLRTLMQSLKKARRVSSQEVYRDRKFQRVYEITHRGECVLDAYQSLKVRE